MTAHQFAKKRKKLFDTRAEAAEALGVTKGAVGHWENGIRPVPLWAIRFLECLLRDRM